MWILETVNGLTLRGTALRVKVNNTQKWLSFLKTKYVTLLRKGSDDIKSNNNIINNKKKKLKLFYSYFFFTKFQKISHQKVFFSKTVPLALYYMPHKMSNFIILTVLFYFIFLLYPLSNFINFFWSITVKKGSFSRIGFCWWKCFLQQPCLWLMLSMMLSVTSVCRGFLWGFSGFAGGVITVK